MVPPQKCLVWCPKMTPEVARQLNMVVGVTTNSFTPIFTFFGSRIYSLAPSTCACCSAKFQKMFEIPLKMMPKSPKILVFLSFLLL